MAELYTGIRVIETNSEVLNFIYKNKFIELDSNGVPDFDKRIKLNYQNQYIVLKFENPPNSKSALCKVKGNKLLLLDNSDLSIQGIKPRNKEQRMALDALLDTDIKVVVLTGKAGTGKTLMSLIAALDGLENKHYSRMLLTKPMTWVGKHGLGYLPGDVNDKFGPYLENYMCNIEFLLKGQYKKIPDLIEQYRIKFEPLQLILGASWYQTLTIADEVQTLDFEEMKTLGTRVGENSKIIIMGDLGQRHENIPKEKTGLYKFVNSEITKHSPLVATIDLRKCERSDVAELFDNVFTF